MTEKGRQVKLSKRILTLVLVGICCSVSASERETSKPTVIGAGAQTCASFVQQSGPNGMADAASLQWVLGYLTGRATATNAWHRSLSGPEGIALQILTYCRAHPVRQLGDAAASLFERNRRCRAAYGCQQNLKR
jgi:hypothetical protein